MQTTIPQIKIGSQVRVNGNTSSYTGKRGVVVDSADRIYGVRIASVYGVSQVVDFTSDELTVLE